MTIAQTTPPGAYALTIYPSGGGKTKSIAVTLTVQAAPTSTPSPTITPAATPSPGISSLLAMLTEQTYLIIIIILAIVVVALAVALIARCRKKKS